MSTGEVHVDGTRLTYELRIPSYEAAHVAKPETALLDAVTFRSGGQTGTPTQKSCREEAGTFVCVAAYQFSAPVDTLTVECRLAAITVPNHVHLMRAFQGGHSDQAAFDASFTKSELRFRPPSEVEQRLRDAGAGMWRALAGILQMLFLATLVLAARNGVELVRLGTMFLAGQVAAYTATPLLGIWLSPRFLEAAAALTVAYLAAEVLLFPQAGARWAVAAVLGMIHGLYFAMVLGAANYHAIPFLSGVIAGEIAIAVLLWVAARVMSRFSRATQLPWERAFASALLAVGIGWFFLRLRS